MCVTEMNALPTLCWTGECRDSRNRMFSLLNSRPNGFDGRREVQRIVEEVNLPKKLKTGTVV